MTLFGRSEKKQCSPPSYDDPPAYDHSQDSSHVGASSAGQEFFDSDFSPTKQLQIEAVGYTFESSLYGNNFEQIAVFSPVTNDREYTSIRLKKSSNSCALVRGADANASPLLATIYRWGPGRPPKIRIFPKDTTVSVEDAINSDTVKCELVGVNSRNMFSRTQIIETSFGTFEWRYGNRGERKEAEQADSLLVMDKIDPSTKNSTRIAQMVRSDEYRTEGTARCMGGNGGRLMIDLRAWTDSKGVTAADIEAFVVASCICMLKREADRFKDASIAAVV